VVATTRPIASSPIERQFAAKSRHEVNHAAENSSGGKKITSTSSGGIATRGSPDPNASTTPPTTSTIGYGSRRRSAPIASTTDVASRMRMSSTAFTGSSVAALVQAGRNDARHREPRRLSDSPTGAS
jgi:hypothetical protein